MESTSFMRVSRDGIHSRLAVAKRRTLNGLREQALAGGPARPRSSAFTSRQQPTLPAARVVAAAIPAEGIVAQDGGLAPRVWRKPAVGM